VREAGLQGVGPFATRQFDVLAPQDARDLASMLRNQIETVRIACNLVQHKNVVVLTDPLVVGANDYRRDSTQALTDNLLRLALQVRAGDKTCRECRQRFPIAFEGQLEDDADDTVVVILDLCFELLARAQTGESRGSDDGRLFEANIFGRGMLE